MPNLFLEVRIVQARRLFGAIPPLLLGTAILLAVVPLIPPLTPGPESSGIPARTLLETGVFLLFTIWVAGSWGRNGPQLRWWQSPGLSWSLAVGLGFVLLPRSTVLDGPADGLLLGISGYLLYRVLLECRQHRLWETILVYSLVTPAVLVAAMRLFHSAGIEPGDFPSASIGTLLAVPLALRMAFTGRNRFVRAGFVLATVILAGDLLVTPVPFGWIILAISGGLALLAALFLRNGESSSSPAGSAVERFYLTALSSAAPWIVFLVIVSLSAPAMLGYLPGSPTVEVLEEWRMTGGQFVRNPLGTGPGNLDGALAPALEPPGEISEPLEPWPSPHAGDLPRIFVELGWVGAIVIGWGLCLFCTMTLLLLYGPVPGAARSRPSGA